jgi:uncharacterized protein involved in exopolysaccharide biosynthesis
MQLKLKANHPDVQAARRVVRDLEQKLETELLETPLSADASRSLPPAEQKRLRDIADARAQIEQLDAQIARGRADVQRLQQSAENYLRRAEAGPTRETEMIELNRDYNTFQNVYLGLLSKKEEANLAGNLERRQIGEQFRLVEAARLPVRPFSPNRPQYTALGMAVGLLIGLGLVAAREFASSSFQTDEEVSAVLTLPVLAVVPLMESAREQRRRSRILLFARVVMGMTVAACAAIVVYTLVR